MSVRKGIETGAYTYSRHHLQLLTFEPLAFRSFNSLLYSLSQVHSYLMHYHNPNVFLLLCFSKCERVQTVLVNMRKGRVQTVVVNLRKAEYKLAPEFAFSVYWSLFYTFLQVTFLFTFWKVSKFVC